MKIKRLTLTLPSRFRNSAHVDARRIAQEIADQLASQGEQVNTDNLSVSVSCQNAQGSTLAQAVGQQVATVAKGNS